MAPTRDVMTLAGRLATFDGPVQITKRRASSAKKTKPATTAEWPHQSPSPDQLARAGFYYKPSSASNDSVTCFLCNKSLDGWDPADNPAFEHLNHVPHCGWAININIEQRNQDPNRMEEDPLSEKMMEARRTTFKDAWPHDGKKGWKCKLEKMVAAGWCFTPIPEADDCVQCFYCGVSLDGWEPKDDPWVEHHKRAPECHFFTLIDYAAKVAKSTKGRKGRTSRTSKASRLSTQSNLTTASDVGSMLDLDDLPAGEGDTMLSTISTMSKAGGAKARTNKAPAKATRKPIRRAKEESVLETSDAIVTDEQPEVEFQELVDRSTVSIKPKTTRGRAAKKQDEDSQVHRELSQVQELPKPKRGKKRGSDGIEKLETSFMPEELLPVSRPTRSKNVDAEASQIETSRVEAPQGTVPVMKRGRPVKKNVTGQADSSMLVIDNSYMQSTITSPKLSALPKSKAGRAGKTKRQIEETTVDEQIMEPEPTFIIQPPQTAPPTTTPLASPVLERPASVVAAPESTPVPPSDKENHAPASSPFPAVGNEASPEAAKVETPQMKNTLPRPTHTMPPVSPTRASTTAALTTTQPWTVIDLSTIFLQSPNKQQLVSDQPVLGDVIAQLSAEERQMSIEAWIIHHATKAEDRLRGECERLIGVFEENGAKAVRSLEGVVV